MRRGKRGRKFGEKGMERRRAVTTGKGKLRRARARAIFFNAKAFSAHVVLRSLYTVRCASSDPRNLAESISK